jgi:hypothetical protein
MVIYQCFNTLVRLSYPPLRSGAVKVERLWFLYRVIGNVIV